MLALTNRSGANLLFEMGHNGSFAMFCTLPSPPWINSPLQVNLCMTATNPMQGYIFYDSFNTPPP